MDQTMQRIRISDLGRVVTGKTPPTIKPEFYGSSYPFITPTDIEEGSRYIQARRFVSKLGKKNFFNAMLPPRSVCFTCIASIGKICMTKQLSLTNQQINSVIVDPAKNNPEYVFYLLKTYANRIKAIASGVATPIINKTAFSEIEIEVHPLPIQRKIASILSAYDDLIENNLRRIKILEEMAQNLYREWFVKFRFPGHEKVRFVDSELGKIPEGWEVDTVENTFTILGGGTPSKKAPEYWEGGDIAWYSPSDLTGAKSMFMDCSSSKITKLGLKKSSAKLFPAFSVMMTSRATLGVLAINTTEACTNQGFITCIPNKKIPLYVLYYWLKENVEYFISLGSGATFKEITKGVFKKIELIVPKQEIIGEFEVIANPILGIVLRLQRKNTILRQTRDLLLPKLISGELDVSELDINMPEEAEA